MVESIYGFRGPTRWLSNFVSDPVKFDGIYYPTVEHAYQAAKCDVVDDRKLFTTGTASDAKRNGSKVPLRKGWDEATRLKTMRDLLVQKFAQEPYRTKLLETGNAYIEETNTWGDTFWGVCDGVGENHLGKMIMEIRSSITPETVTITKAEYESLQDSAFKLQCLEAAGVDNWDGYEFAMEDYNPDDDDE